MLTLKGLALYTAGIICLAAFLFFAPTLNAHDDLEEQIAKVTQQINSDPQNATLYLNRGELYRLHQEWDKAMADYAKAQMLNPQLNEVHLGRGQLYFDKGEPANAKPELDTFLARQPNNVVGLEVRARVHTALKQHLAAAEDYTRAIAQTPKPKPEYFTERAQAYVEIGRLDEALRGLDEGIGKLGPIVTLQLKAIDIEVAMQRYDAALARLDKIMAQAARKDAWLVRRGNILEKAGRPDEAREAYKAALAAVEALPLQYRKAKNTRETEQFLRTKVNP